MKAIAVDPGAGEPALVERPRPEPEPGEALVRTLRVGIDGTDHEVIAGHHGDLPAGADDLILGHEAVGVVEEPNGTALESGQFVVPTVRRRPDENNEFFERGEPDMAPSGAYVERGIVGAHGFMAEYFTSPAEYLVPIPAELAPLGFLVEPISITEKALEHAVASRSTFEWEPDSALVLGNGPLGLITLAMFESVLEFDRTYCLGRRDRSHPTVELVSKLGGTYVDSRETPVSEIPAEHEAVDLVYEATGHAKHAFETVDALAPNGVGVLLGVPEPWEFEVDGGRLHRELVLHNKALLGTVNSHRGHFEAAINTLAQLSDWFTEELAAGVYDLENYQDAFDAGDEVVKTAIEFDTV
ncbi:glucose 1-dehydrogenase [Natrialba magadii ATCC 43099]|uniref:Glucose 1-dehydrogenase n=1 Tax=Natrialba magadii (strain ATCC 43099 / DSM 3394 / CCM 3739 / CIP 104546 / IAM 13178 / JCM 8861 / NBRC 102185 / NCIMB 2190 / MS3) TaxID=547559 RepID=D3SRM5_NATMM|nr:glucose 1-dehydrogenase [Natrialba magadii]ADD04730.1 glucose 1-dehydrogenase [Natrialba magadii ATCC 43099]ELY24897.1 alcohol dehydrogenase GroES domain-containing protein [Natrialba magadii ATCC 43099]